jgi:hypothetical protein
MDTQTDMLVEARNIGQIAPDTTASGAAMNTDRLDSPSAVALDELDVGGSEFSWSSMGSAPPPFIPDAPLLSVRLAPETAVAQESVPLDTAASTTEACAVPEQERHATYFWEPITFKVCVFHNS